MKENSEVGGKSSLGIVLTLGLVFIVVMTLHPLFSTLNLDRHGDMVENYAWGMNWEWGYYKHPPLFGWMTAAWFALFPKTHFWYFLLSAVNAAAALLIIWRIALRYVSNHGAVLTIAIGICLPPLYFLAIKFNANSAMTPLWAAIFLFYLRVTEKPTIFNGAMLGLFSGLAMLTKYYSVVLILPLVLHALWERELRPLLIRPVFIAALITFFSVVTPHILWLLDNEFLPVTYAASQGSADLWKLFRKALEFPIALVLYSLPGYLILLAMWRPGDKAADNLLRPLLLLPATLHGRALLIALAGSIFFTYVLAFATKAYLTAVWALPLFFAVPILMASQIPDDIAARRWKSGLALCLVFLTVSLLISPVLLSLNLKRPVSNNLLPLRAITLEAQKIWKAKTGKDLFFVAGTQVIANGASFYAAKRIEAVQDMSLRASPWVTKQKIAQKGMLVLCLDTDKTCLSNSRSFLQSVDFERTISVPAFKGAAGPQIYRVVAYGQLPMTR